MYNFVVFLLFFIKLLNFESFVHSDTGGLFTNCNIPGQKDNPSDNKSSNMIISSTIGLKNEIYCRNICNAVFSDNNINSIQLNSRVILECTNLCREQIMQNTNDKYTYIASKTQVIPMNQSSTMTICAPDPQNPQQLISQSKTYNVKYDIFSYVSPVALPLNSIQQSQKAIDKYFNIDLNGDTLTLKLNTSKNNTIYGCGHRIVNLTPVFPNMFDMAPQAFIGGNAIKNAASVDMTKNFIENLISNPHYGGLYNFDYDGYIKSFNYTNNIPKNFTALKTQLFCDVCKQDGVLNSVQHDCMSFAKNQKFDDNASKELCGTCNCQYSTVEKYQIQVRVGHITKNDCEAALKQNNIPYDSNTCNITPYTLINPKAFLAYQKLSNVSNSDTSFYKSAWANDGMNSDWTNDTMKYHACFSNMQTPLSNQKLLTSLRNTISTNPPQPNTTISLSNYPERVGCFPEWHIYNTDFLDTTLQISDGDFLKISWGGDIIVGNGLDIPFINQGVAKMLAANDNGIFDHHTLSNNTQQIQNVEFLKMMSTLDFENLSSLVGENGQKPQKNSNNSKSDGVICNGSTIYSLNASSNDQNYNWYGLNGKVYRSTSGIISSDVSCPPSTNPPNNDKTCQNTNLFSDRYEFSGNIQNIGQNKSLKIRHHMPANNAEKFLYNNSIISGGQQVQIEWGGCIMKDGDGLEIAVGDVNSTDNNLTWRSISSDLIKNGYKVSPQGQDVNFQYNSETKLFLRVKTPNSLIPPDGEYNIKVTRNITKSEEDDSLNLMKQLAKTIFTTLIGSPDNINNGQKFDGALVMLSSAIAKNFHPLIIVTLILYISILGLNFMMGTIKMNQQELIKILMQISLVVMVLIPNTWEWFIENYIRLFIVGGLKLAYSIQMTIYSILDGQEIVDEDMFNLFNTWKLFFYVLQEAFSKKLIALITSSLGGLIIAIAIAIAVVFSFILILRAMLVYISMILIQAILLLFTPFVFLARLFKITSNIFDQWFKHLILYSILPTAISITVTMFLLLLIIGIDSTMNFVDCEACMISFLNICLIPNYYSLSVAFLPTPPTSSFLLPMGIVSGALTFLAIALAGKEGVSTISGIISRMIVFRPEAPNRGGATGIMEHTLMSTVSGSMQTMQSAQQSIKSGFIQNTTKRDKQSLTDISKRLNEIDK